MKIYSISGIKLSSVFSGMYKKKRLDLSIIEISQGSNVSGVFTKNKAKSGAVTFSQINLKKTNPKYLIVNSGNANAGTGENGYKDIIKYCKKLSKDSGCNMSDILVFSTGVIGERINANKIIKSIPYLLNNLNKDNWLDFSNSILTTDKINKLVSKKIKIGSELVTITGVAKGSGMIKPNMATMLSFIATDMKIDKISLSKMLKNITERSYNMISVDGEASTNDSSVLIATNNSKINYKKLNSKNKKYFYECLESVFIELAKKIVKDGEGSTKFVTINVDKTSSLADAKNIAMSIANSPLVKTALFAEDPNWGRILSAIGNIDTRKNNISRIEIYFGSILVFKNNKVSDKYKESKAKKYLKNKNIEININYNTGKYKATVWTTDLSYEYIKINADYRT